MTRLQVNAAHYGLSATASRATNSAAIQAAIDSLTGDGGYGGTPPVDIGGVVSLPRGKFDVSPDTISLVGKRNVTLQGAGDANAYEEGDAGTELRFDEGTVGINVDQGSGTGSASAYNTIKNIKIDGRNVLTYGIRVRGRTNISNCFVQGCSVGYEVVNYGNQTIFERVTAFGNLVGIQLNGHSSSKMRITSSNLRQNTVGLNALGGWGVSIDNCVIESNSEEGIIIYKANASPVYSPRFFFIKNNHFENNGAVNTSKYAILIDAETPTYATDRIFIEQNYLSEDRLIDINEGNRIYFRDNIYAGVCASVVGVNVTDVVFYDAPSSLLGISASSSRRIGHHYVSTGTGTGRLISSISPTGTSLQTVNATHSVFTCSSSTSFVDTGLAASIQPTTPQNNVLVSVSLNGLSGIDGAVGYFVLTDGGGQVITTIKASTGSFSASLTYLHSPSTTEAVAYKVRYRRSGGSTVCMNDSAGADGDTTSSITLTEVAV